MPVPHRATRSTGRAWLTRQVGRFRGSLEALLGRLRDDLSHTIARSVGEAVREAVQQLSGNPDVEPTFTRSEPPWRSGPERSWRSPPDYWGDGEPEDRWGEDEREWSEPETPVREPPVEREAAFTTSSRWLSAIATGCRAATWWLGKSRRHPVLESTLVAIVAALGSAWLGPALVTGAAGVCLGWLGLIEAFSTATAALNS